MKPSTRSASATPRPTVFSVCDGCGHIGTECESVVIRRRDGEPFERAGTAYSQESMSVLYCVDCLSMASGPFGMSWGAAAESEVYVVGRTPKPTLDDVLGYLGLTRSEGDANELDTFPAIVFEGPTVRNEVIGADGEGMPVMDLREAVVCVVGEKPDELPSTLWEETGRTVWPTLAAYLWDLYGRCEGDTVPGLLVDVHRIASEG